MFTIETYTTEQAEKLNAFVESAPNGTLFHRPDFLSYHGDRFKDKEVFIVWKKGEAVFAMMPATVGDESGVKTLRSPYGASFGGPVVSAKFKLRHAMALVESLKSWITEQGIAKSYLTIAPQTYYTNYSNYLEFALCSQGFNFRYRECFSTVPLKATADEQWAAFEGRARTSVKKATDQFDIEYDASAADFYPILLEDKIRHDNAKPTHTAQELELLKSRFPDKVRFDIATHKETGARAAICYFVPHVQTIMTFYMAQETAALRLDGTNVLVWSGMQDAIAKGFRYFDFGGSTIGYEIQNMGVAEFKESFGAVGYFRDAFEL